MLSIIKQILSHGNSLTITNWNRITNNVKVRLDIQKQRYVLAPNTQSNSVRMLRALALNVDLKYLMSKLDDMDLYMATTTMVTPLRMLFDQVYQGHEAKDMFISDSNGLVTPELIVSTMHDSPMRTLPLGQGWNTWKTMHPVQVIYHDSLELPWDLGSSQFYFRELPAHYLLVSIDISVYLIKLIKYIRTVKNGYWDTDVIDTFVHHEILASLYEDMLRTWELNVINTTLVVDQRTHLLEVTEETNNQIGLANFNDGLADVDSILVKLRAQEISISDVLATKWLSGGSIFQWMQHLQAKVVIPDLRPYAHLKLMRDLPIVTMVVRLSNQCPKAQATDQLKLYISRRLDQLAMWNIESHVRTAALKTELRRLLETLRAELAQ